MRIFSTSIGYSSSFVVDVNVSFSDPALLQYQRAILVTLDADPGDLTASEESALADFISWLHMAKSQYSSNTMITNPIFLIVNLSTGSSAAFVLTDAKGKPNWRLIQR